MAKLKYCVRCGEERRDVLATETVDGDPLCGMHARIEAACAKPAEEIAASHGRSLLPGEVCSRGCGKAPHRGRCAGVSAVAATKALMAKLPEPVPVLEAMQSEDVWDRLILRPEQFANGEGKGDMDVLVCEEIPASAVPSGRERNIGRMGAMWTRLLATPYETALKVKCRDAAHANTTARHMTLKARKAGIAIVSRRVGSFYYCHRVKQDEVQR